ncbi:MULTISPECIES: dCTP deaminase domain-containing protein [unclassified Streptomyces]|uniref:dCTP deaminase domain-containing protein n=1 Tax=unclassified Streptomyces TaxID=2593676 RepID=UPI0038067110
MVAENGRRPQRPGCLFSQQELLAELQGSERIFRSASWNPEQLLGTGYSVRLGDDLLVIPDNPGDSKYTAIKRDHVMPEFTLAPGDTALISTIEKFSLDFDVTATIGDRFGLAAKGLLILHGSTVHPGYGREVDPENGGWRPKSDERLYFIVANVGPKNITMRKGDSIAYLQFFDIERVPEKLVANVGFDYLSTLFGAGEHTEDGGLSYFRNVKDLRTEVENERRRTDSALADMERTIRANHTEMRRRATDAQTAVDRVTNTSNMIVVFGVFLIATTLLGIAVVMLGDLIDKLSDMDTWKVTLIAVLGALYAGATVTGTVLVAKAAGQAIRPGGTASGNGDGG